MGSQEQRPEQPSELAEIARPQTHAVSGEQTAPSVSRSEIALWFCAGMAAFLAHGGAYLWMAREPPVEMADNAPPPAIMVELAPEPEAIDTEVNEISEQEQNAQEIKSDTTEPVEEPEEIVEQPTPEKVTPEEEPVEEELTEEIIEPETDPIEEQIVTQLENVEVPVPLVRPEPPIQQVVEKPKPKKQEIIRKPQRKKPAPKSMSAIKASAQVTQSNRNAASQRTAGMGFGSVSPARWQSRLMAHLERRKKYPAGSRSRGETGTVYVRFRIDDSGNVLSASLARSSGFAELDAEVLSLVRRASPVPAPPPDVNKTITAPVLFTTR